MEPPSDTEEPTGYVSAEDELVSESENPARAEKEKSRRQIATLYDAVAGNCRPWSRRRSFKTSH